MPALIRSKDALLQLLQKYEDDSVQGYAINGLLTCILTSYTSNFAQSHSR